MEREREAKKWRSEKKVKWNTERGTPRRRAEWASSDMKRLAIRCSNPGPFLWLLKPLAKVKATLSKLQQPPASSRSQTRKKDEPEREENGLVTLVVNALKSS